MNFLEIGAADAARVNSDEHFAWTYRWDRYGLDADIVDAAIDCGTHGGRNGREIVHLLGGSCSIGSVYLFVLQKAANGHS